MRARVSGGRGSGAVEWRASSTVKGVWSERRYLACRCVTDWTRPGLLDRMRSITERWAVPPAIRTWRVGVTGGLQMYNGESVIHFANSLAQAVTGDGLGRGTWVAIGQSQSAWWQLKSPTTKRGRAGWAAEAESMVEVRRRRCAGDRAH